MDRSYQHCAFGRNRGFTLIELLVVVVIIATLICIVCSSRTVGPKGWRNTRIGGPARTFASIVPAQPGIADHDAPAAKQLVLFVDHRASRPTGAAPYAAARPTQLDGPPRHPSRSLASVDAGGFP